MDIAARAIERTMSGRKTFCKLLSPNDSGETGGHQSGFLLSKSAWEMLFSAAEMRRHIAKRNIKVRWQDDFVTDGCLTWYESKRELRLTRFTRGFPFLGADYTGALFVFVKNTDEDFEGYILNTEDEINAYLDAFGLSPADTNRVVNTDSAAATVREEAEIQSFIASLDVDFPSSAEMSSAARKISRAVLPDRYTAASDPDKLLLEWTEEEYRLFRALEHARYGERVANGFENVEEFVSLANQVLNRRKSRAGKSLENHLAAIFDGNNISYSAQAVTEGNKKPDFIFPSQEAYRSFDFPVERLTSLAAKTTCKDRWRQILNEADRLRGKNKFLCTLQQGISSMQMDEMQAERVILVVPKAYVCAYPRDRQDRLWTVARFVSYLKEKERP